jgi:hypothetical protein
VLDGERQRFAEGLAWLFALYPGARLDETTVSAYWGLLRPLELEAVLSAIRRSANAGEAQWPPTAPQLRSVALGEEKSLKARRSERGVAGLLPRTTQGREAYVLAADSPFERLARFWETESDELGLAPGATTPKELGAMRWKEFWKTWEKHGAREVPA